MKNDVVIYQSSDGLVKMEAMAELFGMAGRSKCELGRTLREGPGMRMGSVLLRGGFHPADQFAGGEAVEAVGDLA